MDTNQNNQSDECVVINYENMPDMGDLLEKGFYKLKISKTEFKNSKQDDKLYLSITLDEMETGEAVFDNVMLEADDRIMRRTKSFFKNIALTNKKPMKASFKLNTENLIGLSAYAFVDKDEYKGNEKNVIPFNGYFQGIKELEKQKQETQHQQAVDKVKEEFPGSKEVEKTEVISTESF